MAKRIVHARKGGGGHGYGTETEYDAILEGVAV